MERKSFNDVLKEKELREQAERTRNDDGHMALDDAARVKVLSPGQLVFKRFIRNKLAIFGVCVLLFMFLFSFVGAVLYPYEQKDTFYKYDYTNGDYATASVRSDYTNYKLTDQPIDSFVQRNITSSVLEMQKNEEETNVIVAEDGDSYILTALGEKVFLLNFNNGGLVATLAENQQIGSYNVMTGETDIDAEAYDEGFFEELSKLKGNGGEFEYDGVSYKAKMTSKFNYSISTTGASVAYTGDSLGAAFEKALTDAVENKLNHFTVGNTSYVVNTVRGVSSAYSVDPGEQAMVSSVLVFNATNAAHRINNDTLIAMLLNAYSGEPFEVDGVRYEIHEEGENLVVYSNGEEAGLLTDFVIRDTAGNDTLDIELKEKIQSVVTEMMEKNEQNGSFTYDFPKMETYFDGTDPKLIPSVDENGIQLMEPTQITIRRQTSNYVLACNQWRHLMDISGGPSSRHPLGTDTDGMDVLARMMYGGRVSLLVGFIVVFLETFLGVIMGGIAGYFGGWVDNLIMRLVDIFYCIPSMPILIIMGSFMDEAGLDPYARVAWMMVILGVLGWAGVARLVRGQMLSLREQEFMVATEATGIKVSRRIFRHLIPNVMPQLIVSATMGLGGVILTESTLSFLGLGIKRPMASWGTIINGVTSSNENMIKFTYIWIPVGLLICLTVIAFNFVGDGLRDAFDPKMKR